MTLCCAESRTMLILLVPHAGQSGAPSHLVRPWSALAQHKGSPVDLYIRISVSTHFESVYGASISINSKHEPSMKAIS